jgi:hypothetical protein
LNEAEFEPHIYCPAGPAAQLFREAGATVHTGPVAGFTHIWASTYHGLRWLLGRVGLYSLVGLYLAYTLLPVLWMFLSSILVETDFIRLSADLILPRRIQFGYYRALLMPWATSQIEFGVTAEYGYFLLDALRATTAVASLVAAGAVILGSLAAYAFARLRFPGRVALIRAYIVIQMIPGLENAQFARLGKADAPGKCGRQTRAHRVACGAGILNDIVDGLLSRIRIPAQRSARSNMCTRTKPSPANRKCGRPWIITRQASPQSGTPR